MRKGCEECPAVTQVPDSGKFKSSAGCTQILNLNRMEDADECRVAQLPAGQGLELAAKEWTPLHNRTPFQKLCRAHDIENIELALETGMLRGAVIVTLQTSAHAFRGMGHTTRELSTGTASCVVRCAAAAEAALLQACSEPKEKRVSVSH